MSDNGARPNPPAKQNDADPTMKPPEPTEHNGAVKPVEVQTSELDEFGLPIRPKKLRGLVEEDEQNEDGQALEEEKEKETNGVVHGTSAANPGEKHLSWKTKRTSQSNGTIFGKKRHSQEANGHTTSTEGPPNGDENVSKPKDGSMDTGREKGHRRGQSSNNIVPLPAEETSFGISEYSHQMAITKKQDDKESVPLDDEWQDMPAYAPYDMYNDDNKLIAREQESSDDEELAYGDLGGAGKGYTRVTLDEDAMSATSMDDNTAYLFKEQGTGVVDEDEDSRDALAQMQATKELLTEGQRIAYVGLTRLAILQLQGEQEKMQRTRGAKKIVDGSIVGMKMWGQKMMVRLYGHMDIDPAEQLMIEQLGEHGLQPADLSPGLMTNARVKNPVLDETASGRVSISSSQPSATSPKQEVEATLPQTLPTTPLPTTPVVTTPEPRTDSPPPYDAEKQDPIEKAVHTLDELPQTQNIDIDLRWTVLCDLFLVLIADSIYDARSRQLLERVGSFLDVSWTDICRFEKRVTDALEIQEAASKENWNEDEHIEERGKSQRNRRLAMMGLATVGGGLVIGLSAGVLAPLIGAGLAAGFTTIGVAGTSSFLAGAGGAAIITTTGVLTGGTVGVRAAKKRSGAVRTFEYRPLHNNKRTNLIITVSGWMTGKVDDVRLPFSTVDPIMGDIYSIHWEPEMLRSMGDTINILANEALTQTIQQVLGATILTALMAAIQLPIVLSKLSYLIDNPWSNSLARAHLAGLILADSLKDRNLGTRPVTLVGFSLGAKVIFSCLQELAKKGAFGLIQNVYLFGSPIVANKDEYLKAKSVISGRFVSGYATNDWILGYLFRATGGGIMRVAGLAPVDVPGIENVNVSEYVPGHMAYRAAMPKLLREVGWSVESDEFTEIEDPDPDDHEKRQRELINEIEEARKELEAGKKQKWRFGMFRSKKDRVEKKAWETYDDRVKADPTKDGEKENDGGVLFDVEAIRSEAAELAARTELEAEGLEIRQLESTLPPMKLDLSRADSTASTSSAPATSKTNKSNNDSLKPSDAMGGRSSPLAGYQTPSSRPSYENWNNRDREQPDSNDDGVSMTFDTAYAEPSPRLSFEPSPRMSFDPPRPPAKDPAEPWSAPSQQRPPFDRAATTRAHDVNVEHNAWADDDDDFGKEKEMRMTFE